MENKKFRIGFLGFRKADVCGYIKDINNEFADRLQQKEDMCTGLQKKLDECRTQIAELQSERDKVAGALMLAEEKAKDILSSTEQSANDRRKELDQEYQREQERLRSIRAEVSSVREAAINSIKRFEEKMGELESSIDKKEAALSTAPDDKTGITPVTRPEPNSKINIIKLS